MTFKYVNMTDVNSPPRLRLPVPAKLRSPEPSASPDDERLVAMVELLFFAYRDFVAGPDKVLAELGFGRAHHRVLHFVNRHPGLRVADLLGILKITKQSLARVLKQLVDEGYIVQETGTSDRRERRLHPTQRGADLARQLLGLQTRHLAAALAAAGPEAEPAAASFLGAVIRDDDRDRAQRLVRLAAAGPVDTEEGGA